MSSTDEQPISLMDWLMILGRMVGANGSDERTDSLGEMGAELAKEFAPDAFCRASAVAVARGCLGFPTYGRVHSLMREWRKERKPLLALGAPATPPRAALPAPPRDRAEQLADPQAVRVMVERYEASPPSPVRRICAESLLACLEQHRPEHLPAFRARLTDLIWPKTQAAKKAQGMADAEPERPKRKPAYLDSATLLARDEAQLRQDPQNEALRRNVEARRAFLQRSKGQG